MENNEKDHTLDKIGENDTITEEELKLVNNLFKQCKFSEVCNLLKRELLIKIQENSPLLPIVHSVYIFSLLKLQKFDQIGDILNKYKYDRDNGNILFPINFLVAKYYFVINDFPSALSFYYNLLIKYTKVDEDSKYKDIVSQENNAKFVHFEQFFQTFFSINNQNDKIKKCVFEIKNCFNKLGMPTESYKIIEKYYEMFSDDIVLIFEYLKQTVISSNFKKTEELFNKIKQLYLSSNEETRLIYENYMNFAEALNWISKGEHEIAKNKLTEIMRNNPDNVIIMNNVSVLNLFLNKVDKAYLDFKIILDKEGMNCFNEVTYSNINALTDIFNLQKYP